MTDAIVSLLRASHLMAPDDLASTVALHAREMGAREAVLYLVDYEQLRLLPLPGAGVPHRQDLPIEGTLAGRAFRRVEVVRSAGPDDTHRLWVPLLNGVERLGIAELTFPEAPDDDDQGTVQAFVSLVAELIQTNDNYSDVFNWRRRRRPLSLAAELQWALLPPLSFGTERLVITGGLEPAYDVGGDSFDYAVNGDTVDLLVLDSVGHGLPAAVLASLAVSAYRYARRNGADLHDISVEMDAAIADRFSASEFATAVICRLDLSTGWLRWVNAGHPEPLIVRGTSMVPLPHCPPSRPLGLQHAVPQVCQTRLEPGDRLLLYTDGITEGRDSDGEFFGEQRLADFVSAAAADGDPPPETVRRLVRKVLDHQGGRLEDDASIVVLEWRTGDAEQLQL